MVLVPAASKLPGVPASMPAFAFASHDYDELPP